jgi:Ca-activated chloride channel family protein
MIDRFANPGVLWLAVLLPLAAWPLLRRAWGRSRGQAAVGLPTAAMAAGAGMGWRVRGRWAPAVLRLVCVGLAVLALARPQKLIGQTHNSTRGIAIQVVLDRSGSMGEPMVFDGQEMSRLEAVKRVLAQFVKGDGKELKGREGDLIGLIAFSRFADTVCPLVQAHDALLDLASQTKVVTNRAEDGTAIGDALALGAARLKQAEDDITKRAAAAGVGPKAAPDFEIKSKIMILLTDGASNAGDVTPEQAAEMAAQWGIKIYAIGIGAGESYQVIDMGPFGQQRIPTGGSVDEDVLRRVASETGGKYWEASDAGSLRQIYAEIDRLEKTEVDALETTNAEELYAIPASGAAAGLAAEVLLATLFLRRAP